MVLFKKIYNLNSYSKVIFQDLYLFTLNIVSDLVQTGREANSFS